MNSNKKVTAYFSHAVPTQYTLNINTNGQGTTNPGAGIYTHNRGSQVTITAFPASGWKFDRWGGNASGKIASTTITMNSNKKVTAYFMEMSRGGNIGVSSNLSNASFSLTGPQRYSGTTPSWNVGNAPAGSYTITWYSISGYTTPTQETKTLSPGGSISFYGNYQQAAHQPDQNAIEAANWAKQRVGTEGWRWGCANFVANTYDQQGAGYESAIDMANNLRKTKSSPEQAPVGALLFWDKASANGYSGHVGIHVGDGFVIHAFGKTAMETRITKHDMSGLQIGKTRITGAPYLGWAKAPSQWQIGNGGRKPDFAGNVICNGRGLDNVSIELTGPVIFGSTAQKKIYVTTNSNGYYDVWGLPNAPQYTITPIKLGYSFSPDNQQARVAAYQSGPINFMCTTPTTSSAVTDEFKLTVATIYGEAATTSEASWEAIANVIMNRVGKREWGARGLNTVADVIKYSGFDAYTYSNAPYRTAVKYLDNRDGSNAKIERLIAITTAIYGRKTGDITGGAVLYYSPKAQKALHERYPSLYPEIPKWNFDLLQEVKVQGCKNDDFKFYKYRGS